MKLLYLIRHATSLVNDRTVSPDTVDPPLSDAGIVEARKMGQVTGRAWRHKSIVMLVSPLVRAQDTASIIASYHSDVTITTIDSLAEIYDIDDERITNVTNIIRDSLSDDYLTVVVGHSKLLSAILSYYLSDGHIMSIDQYRLYNCSFSKLEYRPLPDHGRWISYYINNYPSGPHYI